MRRKLGSEGTNTLTEKEQSFVKEAKEKTGKPTSNIGTKIGEGKVVSRVGERVEGTPDPLEGNREMKMPHESREGESKQGRSRRGLRKQNPEVKDPEGIILVTDSFKLKKDVQDRLLRASFERKLSRNVPYTKQAIVNEAIDTWLDANGF